MSKIVRDNFDKFLSNNLCEYLLSTVSNMITLDFETKQKKTTTIDQHSITCAKKIKVKILDRVFLEENFSVAINLFIIAISPDDIYCDDITNKIVSKENAQAVIEQNYTGNENFNNITKTLIENDQNLTNKIDFLVSEKDLISNLDKNKAANIENNINKYSNAQNQIKIIESSTKNFFSTLGIVITSTIFIGASIALLGPMSSLAIIPATIVGVKYGGQIGEKLAEKTALAGQNIKTQKNILDAIKEDFLKLKDPIKKGINEPAKEVEKIQEKDMSKRIEEGIITSLSKHIMDDKDNKISKAKDAKNKGVEKSF